MCRYFPSELSRNEKNLAFRKKVLKKHALETCTSTLFLFPPKYVEETIQGQFNQEAKISVSRRGYKHRAKWPVFWSVQIFSLKWILSGCSSSTYLEGTNKQTVNKKNSNLALGRTCMFGKCLPGRMMFRATNKGCAYGLLLPESIPILDHLHHHKQLDLIARQLGGKTLDHVCKRNIPLCKSGIVYFNTAVNKWDSSTRNSPVSSLTLSVCCPSPLVHLFLTRQTPTDACDDFSPAEWSLTFSSPEKRDPFLSKRN